MDSMERKGISKNGEYGCHILKWELVKGRAGLEWEDINNLC